MQPGLQQNATGVLGTMSRPGLVVPQQWLLVHWQTQHKDVRLAAHFMCSLISQTGGRLRAQKPASLPTSGAG